MTAAIVILATASLIGFLANPVAKWLARGDADLDRLVVEALDRPDYDANIAELGRMGRGSNR